MTTESSLIEVRRKKLGEMREAGQPVFPNQFRRDTGIETLHRRFSDIPAEELEQSEETFSLAGRVMAVRNFGKSCFVHIQDETGRLQLYFQKNLLGADNYSNFKRWVDIGDIVGVQGSLFRTKTEELTLKVDQYHLLVKALRPLPEKYHGLKDVELRYRKRYQDLIVNPEVTLIFRRRAQIIRSIRNFFDQRGFLEVETPMMHSLVGGAAAKPFKTYHNALEQSLFLRIAPELYLKRLLVGGLGKVFELNKNFRNEGLSTRHNPEFTMIEFYEAYADYKDFMALTEQLFLRLVNDLFGESQITYQDIELDFTPPWKKVSLEQALIEHSQLSENDLEDPLALKKYGQAQGIELADNLNRGELVLELFEQIVEENLLQPTFITQYPIEVSPLARRNDENPIVILR